VAEVAEPELMSVLLPVVEPVEPAVPEAPMEVPLPVVEPMPELAPAVVSVLVPVPLVPREPEPVVEAVLLVSDGSVVVDGVVAVEVEEEVEVSVDDVAASSFLPQALRDRAAIRARAAHCAIGDLIIRNSLRVSFRNR
jgi:hypothetical protein